MVLAASHKSPIAKQPQGIATVYALGSFIRGSATRPDQNVYFADSMKLRGMPGWPVKMPNELSWLNMLK